MNNFTQSGWRAEFWQSTAKLPCCSIEKFMKHFKSMKALAFIMLFLFGIGSVLGQSSERTEFFNRCIDDLPQGLSVEMVEAAYAGICEGSDISVTKLPIIIGDNCNWDVEYTYYIKCGDYEDEFKLHFFGGDRTAPVIDPLPEYTLIECPEEPMFTQATATDNCRGSVSLTYVDSTAPGNCEGEYSITRTWTATDGCGNSSTASQTIEVEDNTAPVIDALPEYTKIECPAEPEFAQATASDLCSEVTLIYNDVTTPGSCIGAYSVTRTWTATDACGNSSTASQTIEVEDVTAPVIDALPETSTIECPASPEFAQATASDLCSEITLIYNDVTTPGECEGEYSITRTWTATDDCGNSSTASQTIEVEDITAPVIDALPETSTIECPAAPEFAQATANDLCSEVTLTYNDVTTPGDCEGEYAITRTWTATDDCGNSSTATQTINVEDNTAPVIDALPEVSTIDCPAIPEFTQATASDDCSEVTLTYRDLRDPTKCAGRYSITRTWTATDACGNSSTATQTIRVQDVTAPVIDPLPEEMTLECPATPQFADATAMDACDQSVTLTYNDVTTPGDCEGEYSITRTWTATDDCGNSSTATQTINVEDNTAPVIDALPEYTKIECPAEPEFTPATASDLCSEVTLTYNDVTTPGECVGAYTVTRTWTATDACGNSSTASQTIEVEDITAPVIDALPETSTIECPAAPEFAQATASDLCSEVTLTYNDVTTPGDCEGEYSITRTWTATDDCGNSSTATQTINIEDNTAPVIDALPVVSTIDCPAIPEFTQATASDDCSEVTLTYRDLRDPTKCAGRYSITRTWTATDACGNSSTATQTIRVQDVTAPVIDPLPEEMTLECPATPQFADATAMDACDQSVTLTYNDVTTPGDCEGEYSITRIWTATDDCGNSSTATQTINVEDNTAPVIDALPEYTKIECPAEPEFAQATASDLCSEVTLTYNDVTTPGSCVGAYIVTRTWTATDDCGNSSTASQTIEVEDITAPVIDALPETSTIECPAQPEFAQATASDLCSEVTLTYIDVTTPGDCEGEYSITRTWTATDDCGNSSTATQTINVEDNTAPVIDALPETSTIECPAQPEFAQASASDLCSEVTLTYNDVTTPGECEGEYSITRTWTATDDCGNSSTATQTINVEDNTAPVIDALPEYTKIECPAEPEFAQATASDLCSEVTLTYNDVTTPGECVGSYTVTRTWTATDDCGNSSTASQTIEVEDITAPVIDALPETSTIECPAQPEFAQATASDLCSEVTLTYNDATTPGECEGEYSITRTWTATDDCGNSSTATQTINVEDNTAPVIDALPETSTIECPAEPEFAQATANDLCSEVTLTYNDVTTPGDCEGEYSITRTWTATDDCGNSSTATQTINVEDNTAPVIDALPEASTIECPAAPEFAQATASDLCSEVTLTYNDVTTPGNCEGEYSITRTWTAMNACGNSSTATQTINVEDNTAPVIDALPEYTKIECPAEPEFAQATASDLCSEVTLTYNDVTTPGSCVGAYIVTRTWTATDDCGNSSTASQTIEVEDITAPVIDALPETSTIECPAQPEFAQATASDICSEVTLTYNDVTTPGECEGEYSITRTWTATDDCGNSSTATQTINVEDNIAPVIDALPETSTIECPAEPEFAQATASDLCSEVTLTYNDVTTPGECVGEYSITRTWTATDDCGNSSTATQTINVEDNTAPVIDALPETSTIECPAAPEFAQATASDLCSEVTLTYNDVTTPGNCEGEYSITRTWTAMDACGNSSTATQTINVEDNTAPVIDALPETSTIECPAEPGFAQATASDLCSEVTLTYNDVTTPGECEGEYSITRTWTATDDCGNSSTATQTINVEDNTAPVIDALPEYTKIECPAAPEFAQATASDLCSEVTLTYNDVTTPGSCVGAYTVTRTWTATDDCGNSSTASQTIEVEDITAPVIDALPETSTIECPAQPEFAQATASDICSEVTLTYNDVTTPGECEGEYSITRTWTATDDCGNSSTATQTINVEDNTAPVIDALPETSTIECPAQPEFAQATASDLCSEVTLTYNDVTTPGDCEGEYSITRTWTATDDCGNSSTATQTINVEDTTPPVLIGKLPQGQSGVNACLADAPAPPTEEEIEALFSDTCSNVTATLNIVSPPENNDCKWFILYNFTIQDDCGNLALPVKIYHNGGDQTPPVLTGVIPAGVTGLQCMSDNPGGPSAEEIAAQFTDNCGSVFVVALEPQIVGDECKGWEAVYEYTVEDQCGNEFPNVVIINSGMDTMPPVLTGNIPMGMNSVDLCVDSDLGEPSEEEIAALYTDNCSDVTVTKVELNNNFSDCQWIRVFEYTAMDACGNAATPIKVNYQGGDATGPVITCPDDVLIYGDMEGSAIGSFATSVAIPDNMPEGITTTSNVSGVPSGALITDVRVQVGVNHTWVGDFIFILTAPTGETITLLERAGAPPGTVGDSSNASIDGAVTFTDSTVILAEEMGNTLDTSQVVCIDDGICEYVPNDGTRLFADFIADMIANGSNPNGAWTLNVSDNAAADTGSLGNWTIEIDYIGESNSDTSPEVTGYTTAVDACDDNPDVTYSDSVVDTEDGGMVITRTWTASDSCKNESTCVQIITVVGQDNPLADIACGNVVSGNTSIDGVDVQIPYCETVDSQLFDTPAIIYTYVGTNEAVRFSTCSANTTYDTRLGVFSSLGATYEECVAGNDDAACTHSNLHSTTTFYAQQGVTYYIYVAGFAGDSGQFELSVNCDLPNRDDIAEDIKLDFVAYPVPFDHVVSIKYNFEFDTDVNIDVHDTKGLLVLSQVNQNYRRNNDQVTKLDLSRGGDQIFYVTITTNRGNVTKKIVSSGRK
ncbi:MAG: HYR-like domain-containing protein [Aquaticitalea sp.]